MDCDSFLIKQLVRAKRGNDNLEIEATFKKIVQKYQKRLMVLFQYYLKDAGEAEDLTQEVFIKVFKKVDTFKGASKFFTWLYKIAINTAHDFLDKKRRRPKVFFLQSGPSFTLNYYKDGEILDGRLDKKVQTPIRKLEEIETAQIVRDILNGLPEPFKTTLFLREFEDLSYQEISFIMECSIGTVESRLFRARVKFKTAYEKIVGTDRDLAAQ